MMGHQTPGTQHPTSLYIKDTRFNNKSSSPALISFALLSLLSQQITRKLQYITYRPCVYMWMFTYIDTYEFPALWFVSVCSTHKHVTLKLLNDGDYIVTLTLKHTVQC